MKKLLALICTAVLLMTSGCGGTAEAPSEINLVTEPSETTIEVSSEVIENPEIYANWKDDLPLKLITDVVPVWISRDKKLTTSLYYEKYSNDWYRMKYIGAYVVPIHHDMSSSDDISTDDVLFFFISYMEAHINPDNYVNVNQSGYVFPRELIETVAQEYFGITELENNDSQYYNPEFECYELPFPSFGGMWLDKINTVKTDGNIITIYADWYDDEYYTNYVKSTIYTIEDNGDTFRYISVKTTDKPETPIASTTLAPAETVAEPAQTTSITEEPPSAPSETAGPLPDSSEPAKAPETTIGE